MSDFFCLPFSTHPLRDALYDELHARPFQVVSTPQQISHLAFKAEPHEQNAAFERLCELCQRYGVETPAADAVSFQQELGEFAVRWERHMEFYALTFKHPRGTGQPFAERVIDLLPPDWLASLPGQAVAAFHLVVDDGRLDTDPEVLTSHFEGQRLIISQPKEGKAHFAPPSSCTATASAASWCRTGGFPTTRWAGWCSVSWSWKPTVCWRSSPFPWPKNSRRP